MVYLANLSIKDCVNLHVSRKNPRKYLLSGEMANPRANKARENHVGEDTSPFRAGPRLVGKTGAGRSSSLRGENPQIEVSSSLNSLSEKKIVNLKVNLSVNQNAVNVFQTDKSKDSQTDKSKDSQPDMLKDLDTPTGQSPVGAETQIIQLTVIELLESGDIHPAVLSLGLKNLVPSYIGGRLHLGLENWRKLTQDQTVLQTVQGLRIPFTNIPVQDREPHQYPLSEKDSTLVDAEIVSMIEKGAISTVHPQKRQYVSPLFLVPKKDGTQRPVINLKQLNFHVEYQHFKMEGLHMLRELLQPNDFMIKIDLKDAYFSVPVHHQHRPYLRFRWKGK